MTVDIRATALAPTKHRARGALRISAPELLCMILALVEGLAAAAIFLAASFVYHLGLLHLSLLELPVPLFAGFALAIGVTNAGFGFGDYARLLASTDRLSATLTRSLYGWSAAFGIGLLLAFLTGTVGDLSRISIVSAFLIGAPISVGLRALMIRWVARSIAGGRLHYEQVAVVGLRADVKRYLQQSNLFRHGRQVSATFYLEPGDAHPEDLAHFAAGAVAGGVESIVLVTDHTNANASRRLLDMLRRFSVNIDLVAVELSGLAILDVIRTGDSTRLRIARKPLDRRMLAAKRAADVIGAGFGLLALSPLFAVVALAIKLEGPGPVFFRQERRGFNGQTFMIWKFRSMRVLESGSAVRQAGRNDARFTRVGRFLRRTSIDELPQLINVLRNEMSLVGPRPHAVSHDDALIEQLADYAYRNRIKPGITGWAQVNGHRGETRTAEQIRARVACDLYYIDNWTVFLDSWIVLLTLFSPRVHRGAF